MTFQRRQELLRVLIALRRSFPFQPTQCINIDYKPRRARLDQTAAATMKLAAIQG